LAERAAGFHALASQNIQKLADEIGVPLEVETQEKHVGPYKADLVCRIQGTEKLLFVIENQFGGSDHQHLGQLLTYAAGLDAKGILWIAERFTEEHKSFFQWLNDNTNSDVKAFAVEISLHRIGKSPAAPQFKIVSMPNGWNKQQRRVREVIALTPTGKRYLNFWDQFSERTKGIALFAEGQSVPTFYRRFDLGRAGFALEGGIWTPPSKPDEWGVFAQVAIKGIHRKPYFVKLKAQKKEIEKQLHAELDWDTDSKQSSIALYRAFDGWEENKWPSYHSWLKENLEALNRVFRERVRALS
jgi:hypothetical protein